MVLIDSLSATVELIALLRDGEKGFSELAEHIEDAECRAYLREESCVRAAFAVELERLIRTMTGAQLHPTGTRLATLHRGWMGLRARWGADDTAMLEATELCERYAVKAYEDVLDDDATPEAVSALLAQQVEHVRRSRGIVREYRALAKAGAN